MEPILHTEYFIRGNLLISIKGEVFGTAVKKEFGQFPLYFVSHKWNIIRVFFEAVNIYFLLFGPDIHYIYPIYSVLSCKTI